MKRIEALQTLSREHLSALMLASCLKNGKSSNPRYPWPIEAKSRAQKVVQMWHNELHWHFEAEERFFFERFEAELSDSLQTVSRELVQDHQDIKALILSLDQLNEPELPPVLNKLGILLDTHVRREESIYFEGLQREIAPEALEQSHQALLNYYDQRDDFQCIFTGETRQPESQHNN